MPAAVITLYCYWLCYSALSSDPSVCNTLKSDEAPSIIIGLVLAGECVLVYVRMRRPVRARVRFTKAHTTRYTRAGLSITYAGFSMSRTADSIGDEEQGEFRWVCRCA